MLLKTKNLTCLYQNGNLRYIKWGDTELVRMIYSAVRDSLWLTATMTIFDEKIEQSEDSFRIQYKAKYVLNSIDYQAFIKIEGGANDTISFHFEGEAQSDFLKNRIGLCVHHPIRECAGQTVFIENTDLSRDNREGGTTEKKFPKLISPHQPFLNVQKMLWQISHNPQSPTHNPTEATLLFGGDIFETEDQRNWTDGSFKTYSTPLSIPYPVAVKKGDKVVQSVVLQIKRLLYQEEKEKKDRIFIEKETRLPFPKIGYARSKTPLNVAQIELLKQVPFDHYRVECFFQTDWENDLNTAFFEAGKLDTKIELMALLSENTEGSIHELLAFLDNKERIESLLFVGEKGNTPTQHLLDIFLPKMKNTFPNIKLGAGTDAFFAELNRNRPTDMRLDFISFSINPQVHLTDNQTLIENLEAQKYTLETAQSFFPNAIHVSPITLKWRHYPTPSDSIDARQHTPLAAYWTAISIKYLAAAKSLTFYETIGEKGILNDTGHSPIYDALKKIKDFQPVFLIQNKVEKPLIQDSLILENKGGERLVFDITFSK